MPMHTRILVDFSLPPDALELLRAGTAGHELMVPQKPAPSVLAKAEWEPAFAEADIIFGQPDPVAIAASARLKWIQVSTSSITRYDNPEFRARLAQRHIALSNSASVYNEACALHALSFLLAQARQLPLALRSRTPGGTREWNALRQSCVSLQGQTIVIVGYGAIGRRLAEWLRPFGANLLAYRRRARGDEVVPVIPESQFARVLATEADHVIDILPDSAETRGFFNTVRFAALKPGAVFYNIGRGTTVDQGALLAALRSGRLAAAWLDVTEPEPLPEDHPLLAQPNCFVTPHVAGGHRDESHTLVRHFLANLKRYLNREPLLDQIA